MEQNFKNRMMPKLNRQLSRLKKPKPQPKHRPKLLKNKQPRRPQPKLRQHRKLQPKKFKNRLLSNHSQLPDQPRKLSQIPQMSTKLPPWPLLLKHFTQMSPR